MKTILTTIFFLIPFYIGLYGADLSDLTYEVSEDGVTIKKCSIDADGELIIPSTIESLPVISIGDYAFSGCTLLTSIKIPVEVLSIGDWAFSNCSSLTSISLPDSLIELGYRAFYGCTSMVSVTLPKSLTSIDDGVFAFCTSLSDITIPQSVTRIGVYAFADCHSLESIKLQDGLTSIGERAFYRCKKLSSVVLPRSVSEISRWAFGLCESLRSATFEGDVPASFDQEAFVYTAREYSAGDYTDEGFKVYYYKDSSGFTSPTWRIYKSEMIATPDVLSYIVQANGVTITDCDISATGDLSIPRIIQGKPVTSIADEAFSGCNLLYSISFPDSVKSIGKRAFSDCSVLTKAIFEGDAPISFGPDVFYNTAIDFTVYFNDSATGFTKPSWQGYNVKNRALLWISYAVNEDSVTITDCDVQAIGKLIIPSKIGGIPVTHIGDLAFNECTLITSIELPESVVDIGMMAFASCRKLTSINLPEGILSIKWQTFAGCNSLVSIKIPSSVTSIGIAAFYNCDSLTSINIPASVTTIENQAFIYCYKLVRVNFYGDAPTSFGSDVFADITRTTIIYYYEGADGFTTPTWQDESCREIPVSGGIPYLTYSINVDGATIINCDTSASGQLIIPRSIEGIPVTSIAAGAFSGCSELTGIVLPDALKSIGDAAFVDCTRLESIVVPNILTGTDYLSFLPTGLQVASIGVLPENSMVKSVRGLLYNYNLTELIFCPYGKVGDVDLPYGITTVATKAFFDRYHITSIYLPDSLTTISEAAFANCSSLSSIRFSENLVSVGNFAFWWCKSLRNITLPESLKSIGYGAFEQCRSLGSDGITIPESVETINDNAFDYCVSLASVTFNGDAPSGLGSPAFRKVANGFKVLFYEGVRGFTAPLWKGVSSEEIPVPGVVPRVLSYVVYSDRVTIIDCETTAIGRLVIPDLIEGKPVKLIGNRAFQGCTKLTAVILPNTVETIGQYAFSNCYALEDINLPGNLRAIEEGAFSSNRTSMLNELDLPQGLTTIGKFGLIDVSYNTITIPQSVTAIGDYALIRVQRSVIFEGNAPTNMGTSVFQNTISVYFNEGADGFTEPTWKGYQSIMIPSRGKAEVWLNLHLKAETPEQLRTLTADADSDGMSNLLEYALGSNPNAPDSDGGFIVSDDSVKDAISFVSHCRTGDSALTLNIALSSDLESWTDIALGFEENGGFWSVDSEILEIVEATELENNIWRLTLRDKTGADSVFTKLSVDYSP